MQLTPFAESSTKILILRAKICDFLYPNQFHGYSRNKKQISMEQFTGIKDSDAPTRSTSNIIIFEKKRKSERSFLFLTWAKFLVSKNVHSILEFPNFLHLIQKRGSLSCDPTTHMSMIPPTDLNFINLTYA